MAAPGEPNSSAASSCTCCRAASCASAITGSSPIALNRSNSHKPAARSINRRRLRLREHFAVRFFFPDAQTAVPEHWLVCKNGQVDLCYFDPGHEVNVEIQADLRTMTGVWMGREDFHKAQEARRLVIQGEQRLVARAKEWLGLSKLAAVTKRPEEFCVLLPIARRKALIEAA